MTVDVLLDRYPAEVRVLALLARRMIRRLLPRVEERVDRTAPVIGYGYGPGYTDTVCVLILSKAGVKIGLPYGTTLPDPCRLLKGSGKIHRHVELKDRDDLRQPAVTPLIKAAYAAWRQRRYTREWPTSTTSPSIPSGGRSRNSRPKSRPRSRRG